MRRLSRHNNVPESLYNNYIYSVISLGKFGRIYICRRVSTPVPTTYSRSHGVPHTSSTWLYPPSRVPLNRRFSEPTASPRPPLDACWASRPQSSLERRRGRYLLFAQHIGALNLHTRAPYIYIRTHHTSYTYIHTYHATGWLFALCHTLEEPNRCTADWWYRCTDKACKGDHDDDATTNAGVLRLLLAECMCANSVQYFPVARASLRARPAVKRDSDDSPNADC